MINQKTLELPFFLAALLKVIETKGTESISGELDRLFGKAKPAKRSSKNEERETE
jgi:hypothetical protein